MTATTDLNLLRAFVAVAETSSFSIAARRLSVPKSSVSRAVKRLEDELGTRLVHRTTRSVALSTAGEALYARVAARLKELEQAVHDLPEREEEPSGELRVTAAVDFGGYVLADVIARFTARWPAVRVDMHLSNELVDLVAQGFDVAFRISGKRLADSSLHAQKIGALTSALYASPTYLAKRGAPRAPKDLAEHDCVLFRGHTELALSDEDGKTVKATTKGRVNADDLNFVHQAVRAGAGVAMLPTFLVEVDVATGALVRVLPKWAARTSDVYVVHPGGAKPAKKVVAFRDFARAQLAARGVVAG